VIELFKIMHNEYDIGVTPVLEFNNRGLTRGNKYNLLNKNFHYNIRQYSFTAGVVDIRHSLQDYIVDVDSINTFQSRFPQVTDLVSDYFFCSRLVRDQVADEVSNKFSSETCSATWSPTSLT